MSRPTPRKQLLLDTAYRLFNEYGYHATGIDRILAESGVSKATLYKHFSSKEALILAVLEQRHEALVESMRAQLESVSGQKGILSLFDALEGWFTSEQFFGCNFIRASGEYVHKGDAIYQFAAHHKQRLMQLMTEYLNQQGAAVDQDVAQSLLLLIDGAIVAAHMRGDFAAARRAKVMASAYLEAR